jgi:hypothetical protein
MATTPEAPKEVEQDIFSEAITREKKKADVASSLGGSLKGARDAALTSLYEKSGAEHGFGANTPEDQQKFADWLVEGVATGTLARPTLAPEARDIYLYEAATRYGSKVKSGGDLFHAHQEIRKGAHQNAKRKREREAFEAAIPAKVQQLGLPPETLVTVMGEEVESLPHWKKGADDFKRDISLQYAGTAAGNNAGLAIDDQLGSYQTTLDSLTPEQVLPEEREELAAYKARRKKAQEQRAKELKAQKVSPASMRYSDTVSRPQIIIPQVQLANGQWAVDLGALEFEYTQGVLAEKANKAGYSSWATLVQSDKTPEEIGAIRKEAEKEAKDLVEGMQLRSLNSVLFLKDPRKFTKALKKGEDFFGRHFLTAPLTNTAKALNKLGVVSDETTQDILDFRAPFARVLYPQSVMGYDTGAGQGTLHYARNAEQLGDGTLDWFFNFGPWQPIFSWYLDPREDLEWGSTEHLEKQGQNYNMFQEIDALDEKISESVESGALSLIPGSGLVAAGLDKMGGKEYYAALALTLVEPDLFTAFLLGPKIIGAPLKAGLKAAGGVGKVSQIVPAMRARRGIRAIDAAVKELEKAETIDEQMGIVRDLKKKGYEQEAQVLGSFVAGQMTARGGQRFDVGPDLQRVAGNVADNFPDDRTWFGGTIKSVSDMAASKRKGADLPEWFDTQLDMATKNTAADYTARRLKEIEARENLRRAVAVTGEVAPNDFREATWGALTKKVEASRSALRTKHRLKGRAIALEKKIKAAEAAGGTKELKALRKEAQALEIATRKTAQKVREGLLAAPVEIAYKEWQQAERLRQASGGRLGRGLRAQGLSKKEVSAAFKDLNKTTEERGAALRIQSRSAATVKDSVKQGLLTIRKGYEALLNTMAKAPGEQEQVMRIESAITRPYQQVVGTGKERRVELDMGAWVEDLVERFGSAAVEERLGVLRGGNRGTNILREKILAKEKFYPSPNEIRVLDEIGHNLATSAWVKENRGMGMAQQILRAWRDDIKFSRAFKKRPEEWGALMAKQIRRVGDKFDVARSRMGPYATRLQEVASRATIRGEDNEKDLVEVLIRQGVGEPGSIDFPTAIYSALDTNQVLRIGSRAVTFNQVNAFTVYQNFQNYILGLTRGMDPKEAVATLRDNPAFQAAVLSYLPAGTRTTAAEAGNIARRMITQLPQLDSAQAFAEAVRNATLAAYRGRIAREGVQPSRKLPDSLEELGDTITPDHVALTLMSRGMLHGQNWRLINDELASALGPGITPEAALKANFVLGHAAATSPEEGFRTLLTAGTQGFDPTDAFDAIERWGLTFNRDTIPKAVDLGRSAHKDMQDLKAFFQPTGRSSAGVETWAAHPFVRQIDDKLQRAVKTLDATPRSGGIGDGVVDNLKTYMRLWRTSVTRGLLFPRPAYLANQAAGDFAQMLMPEGLINIRRQAIGEDAGKVYLTGALPMSFQNAFTYVPYFGKKMSAAIEDVGEFAASKGFESLTTPLNALVNPFVQRIMTGRNPDQLYETAEGWVRADRLLAEMAEDNVFDVMFNDDLRKLATQWAKEWEPDNWQWFKPKGVRKVWSSYQRFLNDIIHETQNHQRAAYYLEQRLRRGATRGEARKALEETLYNWRHGVSHWEMEKIASWASFYPYTRLAVQQMGNALLEPLTFSIKDTLKNSITGNTKINRVRKLGQVTYGMPTSVDWSEDEGPLNYALASQYVNLKSEPFWVGGRPVLASGVLTPEEQAKRQEETGRLDTNLFRIGPSFGTPETMKMYLTLFEALAGTAAYGTGAVDEVTLGSTWKEDTFNELILNQLNPPAKAVVKAVWDDAAAEGGFQYRHPSGGRRVPISANEVAQLAYKFPFLQEWVTQDERGYYMNGMAQELILSFPVVGTEIPRVTNQVMGESVDWDRGTAKGMAWMLADFLGLARTYYTNPELSRDYTAKSIQRDIQREIDKKKRAAKAGGAIGQEIIEYEP